MRSPPPAEAEGLGSGTLPLRARAKGKSLTLPPLPFLPSANPPPPPPPPPPQIPDGKPANKFGLDDKCMPRDYALHVIEETNEAYKRLKSGKIPNEGKLSLQ